ncbi:hypothetical protein MC885_010079 [Smutsia gigantea]|nr:hypothetical protein MC885_010079 [Smutsia gigantea]
MRTFYKTPFHQMNESQTLLSTVITSGFVSCPTTPPPLSSVGHTVTVCFHLLAVSELQEEGMNAINLPLSPIPFELDPEDTMLEENEVRTMVLIDWINDVLVGERIIVKDLAEDLYDGQVLQKLFEKLESEKLNVAEVTQSEIAQKQKLQTVLEKINETLKLPPRSVRWNVDCEFYKESRTAS